MTTHLARVGIALVALAACGAVADDENGIEGLWRPASGELGGQPLPADLRESIRLEVRGDRYTVTVGDRSDRGTCKIDPSASPRTLDIVGTEGPNKGKTVLAIYERTGDTLRVCYDLEGKTRPAAFKSPPGSQIFLVEYRRQAP